MKYYWRKPLFGKYAYTVIFNDRTFVSKPFDKPIDALLSLKKIINESK